MVKQFIFERNKDKLWIKETSSKAIKQSIINAETSYKRFFTKQSKFPKFHLKHNDKTKFYFVKTDSKTIIKVERYRIKIPTIGWVILKEKGYIPHYKSNYLVKSGTISYEHNRWYVSCLVDIPESPKTKLNNNGIGIDLGIKNFITISNGKVFDNINKTKKIKKLESLLKTRQKSLSKKFTKGDISKKYLKQKSKVNATYRKLTNIRTDYVNQCVSEIVKTKSSYITIEDLNIKGMLKNRCLSKSIKDLKLYEFRMKLQNKCREYGVELRIANRFYPRSKMCSECGTIYKDLKLSDRVYKCECGNIIDRDLNASINLMKCNDYKVA